MEIWNFLHAYTRQSQTNLPQELCTLLFELLIQIVDKWNPSSIKLIFET